MASQQKTLYIIDGNSLLHRAWHAIPPLTTKDGTVVNAVYGFAMVLHKLLTEKKPTHIAVCWDVQGGTFRDEVFEDYKAGREEKEQELYDQIPLVDEFLRAFGIPSFGIEGFEADDLIGTVAEHVRRNKAYQTVIITGDLDALQLVDDSTVVEFFVKGLSQTKLYDSNAVRERYGFGPEHIVDYKALKGDASDNIPGVKGIGDKGATELILAHGSLDGVYSALKDGKINAKESLQNKLKSDEKNARMSLELATIKRDVPMKFSLKDAHIGALDWEKVAEAYRRFEFTTLLRRIEGLDGNRESSIKNREIKTTKHRKANVVVDTDGVYVDEAMKALSDAPSLALDIRDHAEDLFGSSITALTLSDGTRTFVFRSPSRATLAALSTLLTHGDVVTHDAKRLWHLLSKHGLTLSERGTDMMLVSYLIRAGNRDYDIPSMLEDLVGVRVTMPKHFETDDALMDWGGVIARFLEAAHEARTRLQKDGMLKLYDAIEHPTIFILARMEATGIEIDVTALHEMSKRFEGELGALTKRIHKEAGVEFNINSPSQLANVLFDTLDLPTKGIKRTQSGYSTAAPMLEKLYDTHPIVPLIGEYRELAKLKSTYIDALPVLRDAAGRVHTTYNQTVAVTGRLSSQDPNLQNIPIRTDLGREIRAAFVAPRGCQLVSADYSQIELRLVAALSGDKTMVQIFKDGGDIHQATAAKVFGVAEEEVTKKQRRAAKTVNFGIIYGMGPRALSRSIEVSFAEAKAFIEKYFETFPSVRAYLDEVLMRAKQDGFAQSHFGRRRYLPDLDSGVQMVRAAAERMAKNMPLQGTASDVMKMAMIEVDAWIRAEAFGDAVRLLLQVHDELVLEVVDDQVEHVAKSVKHIMERVADFDVPLTVNVASGKNWKAMKAVDV